MGMVRNKVKQFGARIKRIAGYGLKPVIEWIKDGNVRARARYARYYKTLHIRKKTILYESFGGRGMNCNPYALFRAMLYNPKYKGYTHIWVLDNFSFHKTEIEEYSQKNVIFVQYQSRKYLKWLASAEILINNVSFYEYYIKKEGQTYINTWHGIPLKHLGKDMPNGVIEIRNVIRSLLQTDYLLSANSFLTKIYQEGYDIREIYNGTILEEGYPRTDLLYSNRNYILEKLHRNGVNVDPNKKIILYAPTWRGTSYGNPTDTVEQIISFRNTLMSNIDTNLYQILVKPHNALHELMRKYGSYNFVVPASFDANEILSQTDILISDFSSIYFDFLSTKRPILFYIPDEKEYQKERGLYFRLNDLPSSYTDDPMQIAAWINDIETVQSDTREQYEKVKNFCEHADDIKISEKIIDIIFHNKEPHNNVQIRTDKKRILMFKGTPLLNGIGTSFYNLLNSLDYNKYDVTIYMFSPKGKEQINYVCDIPKQCRVLLRVGSFTSTLSEQIKLNYANEYCYSYAPIRWLLPHAAYKREIKRCFGNTSFDYIIDFEGYTRMMDMLATHMQATRKMIWQHNDMKNEFTLKYQWLKHLFSTYPEFDGIVSCAKAVMEENKKNLATTSTLNHFYYATNLFDGNRVQNMLNNAKYVVVDERSYYICESTNNEFRLIPLDLEPNKNAYYIKDNPRNNSKTNYTDSIQISEYKTWRNGVVEIYPASPKDSVKFISVGRCSPEKNHIALIDGFERLLKEYPNTILYIVGSGPKFNKEYDYVIKRKLEKRIIMTGNLKNPFGLMQKCNCFILPSIHEGQPISILEARVLGMPIIMSNFSTARSSLVKEGQLLIGTSPEEIYQGMKAYIEGQVPHNYHFDVQKYNKECYQQFESLLGESE